MTPEAQKDAIVEALKRLLRERDVAYPDVARHLGVSLATVKRMMRGTKPSLEDVAAIAELCGVTLADVVERAKGDGAITFFDEAQDALFFERPAALAYFELLAAGRTPAEIEARHGLRRASTVKYLAALERVRLVDVLPGDRVRLRVHPPFGFGRTSRYLAKDVRAAVDAIVGRVLAKLPSPERDMILLKPIALTPESYEAMKRELREIVERYARTGESERRAGRALRPTTTLVVCDEVEPPAERPIDDF